VALEKQVENVKARAQAFLTELGKSEPLTRYVLIDPVLRALGWDTEDPSQVRPEFPTESGNPDYALLWEGKPWIMVEAKALGKSLSVAREKGFQYCWKAKVPYYVITDGNAWELHDLREMGGKEIFRVELDQVSAGEAARALLALWRPALPNLEMAPHPVVTSERSNRPQIGFSLLDLEGKMKRGEIPSGSPPPKRLVFPDGQERELRSWRDLLLAVVEWRKDKLSAHVPVKWPRTGRSFIARNDAGMRSPRQLGDYWVETHGSASGLVRAVLLVLSILGEDPEAIQVIPR